MKTRTEFDLRGSVRTCQLERDGVFISSFDFNRDGFSLRQSYQNPDGSTFLITNEYNQLGQVAASRAQSGKDEHLSVFEYDHQGRLTKISCNNHVCESYEYDAENGHKKKKISYIDPELQKPSMNYSVQLEGATGLYPARGAATFTTLYNDKEKPVEGQFHDSTGMLLSRVILVYDDQERLVGESQIVSGDLFPAEAVASLNASQLAAMRALFSGGVEGGSGMTHRYDEKGHRVATTTRIHPICEQTETFSYNEHGDQIGSIWEEKLSEGAINDEGEVVNLTAEKVEWSESRMLYEYDAHGNWILKTVEWRGSTDEPFRVSTVEKRTITYFD